MQHFSTSVKVPLIFPINMKQILIPKHYLSIHSSNQEIKIIILLLQQGSQLYLNSVTADNRFSVHELISLWVRDLSRLYHDSVHGPHLEKPYVGFASRRAHETLHIA